MPYKKYKLIPWHAIELHLNMNLTSNETISLYWEKFKH